MTTKTAGTPRMLLPVMQEYGTLLGIELDDRQVLKLAAWFIEALLSVVDGQYDVALSDMEPTSLATEEGLARGEGEQTAGGWHSPPEYEEVEEEFEYTSKWGFTVPVKVPYKDLALELSERPGVPSAWRRPLQTSYRELGELLQANKRLVLPFVRGTTQHITSHKNTIGSVSDKVHDHAFDILEDTEVDGLEDLHTDLKMGPVTSTTKSILFKSMAIEVVVETIVEVESASITGSIEEHWREPDEEGDDGGDYDIYGRYAGLRSKLVRLAHMKPELRPALLPLLKEATAGYSDRLKKLWDAYRKRPEGQSAKEIPQHLKDQAREQTDKALREKEKKPDVAKKPKLKSKPGKKDPKKKPLSKKILEDLVKSLKETISKGGPDSAKAKRKLKKMQPKTSTLRSKLIHVANANPEIRSHLLPLLKQAYPRAEKGSGGLLFDYDRGFSVKEQAKDPHGQVYDGLILMDNGPKRPYRAAVQAALLFKKDLLTMRDISAVRKYIDEKTYESVGKYPKWHRYSMPD